jgi:hypothetical protein
MSTNARDISTVTTRIVDQLEQPQSGGDVRSAVESEFKRFNGARVREFVPVIVERRVRSNLRQTPFRGAARCIGQNVAREGAS